MQEHYGQVEITPQWRPGGQGLRNSWKYRLGCIAISSRSSSGNVSIEGRLFGKLDGVFGGTLMVGLITEPLGSVLDAQDVMVLFDEWLAVLGLCSVRVLDELSAGRDACMS